MDPHFLLSPDDLERHITQDHGMTLDEVAELLPDNDGDIQGWLIHNNIPLTGESELDALTMWHEEEHMIRIPDHVESVAQQQIYAPGWLMHRIWTRVVNAMSTEDWQAYAAGQRECGISNGRRIIPIGIEARCGACGETFIPADEDDTVHIARSDGTECGGQGVIVGSWR